MIEAPWPYEPMGHSHSLDGPRWHCPGGLCECHPPESRDDERREHRIHFFDHHARRLRRPRCRVFENGRLLNVDDPYAEEGILVVRVLPTTSQLFIEWAPEALPRSPQYPYRLHYQVALGGRLEDEVQARLANISFASAPTVEGNVADFQLHYVDQREGFGRPEDIDNLLKLFHDAATLPPLGTKMRRGPAGRRKAKTSAKKKLLPQGCAAALVLPRVRVELSTIYNVKPSDLRMPLRSTVEALRDPSKLLDEYKRNNILAGAGIRQATFVPLSPSLPQTPIPTNRRGVATLDISGAQPSSTVRFAIIPPDENRTSTGKRRLQLNETNEPAGPQLIGAGRQRRFRPFILEIDVDANGIVPFDAPERPSASALRVVPAKAPKLDPTTGDFDPRALIAARAQEPPFVKLVELTTQCGQRKPGRTPVVVIDWRPDWAKSQNVRPRPASVPPFSRQKKPTPGSSQGGAKSAPRAGIIIHHTHGVHMGSTVDEFITPPTNPADATSAHYVVDLDGHTVKLVDEEQVSFHAGIGQWDNHNEPNFFSVGIETIHSDADTPGTNGKFKYAPREFTQDQYDSIIRLCKELQAAPFDVAKRYVQGHRDVKVIGPRRSGGSSPSARYKNRSHGGKPDCPGMCFQWEMLEQAGVAVAPASGPAGPANLEDGSVDLWTLAPERLSDLEPSGWPQPRRQEAVLLLKRCLFHIGYSVSTRDPAPLPSGFSGRADAAFMAAVSAFQTHHFSGSRRAYNHESHSFSPLRSHSLASSPKIGVLDQRTIRAILECWWGILASGGE